MVCKTKVTLKCQALQCLCHGKYVIWLSVLVLIYLLQLLWWFSQPFQWFLHLKQTMIQTILSALSSSKQTKNNCMHHCTILRYRKTNKNKKMTVCITAPYWGAGKVIQQSWLTQTEMEWSIILQSALTLWDLSIWGGGRRVLAVNVFASSIDMWSVWPLVWHWAFIVLLADQHQKWSCLARASTCFWTQRTESQCALFQL